MVEELQATARAGAVVGVPIYLLEAPIHQSHICKWATGRARQCKMPFIALDLVS